MKRVLSFLKPQTGRTAVQIFLKFTATLVELFLPWILEHIIDVVAPTGQKTQLVLWGGLMLLCALAAFFGAVIANRMAAKIAAEFTRSLRRTQALIKSASTPATSARWTASRQSRTNAARRTSRSASA